MASSSSATPQHEYPTCFCGDPAPLRRSNTAANPGRRFLGCANYERKEKKCKYFYWVDPSSREKELEAKNALLEKMCEDLGEKNQEVSKEKKKLKKKLMVAEAKVISYQIGLVVLACIIVLFTSKNGSYVGNVKCLP